MRYSLAALVAAAIVQASPVPQGVTSAIAPTNSAPSGCSVGYSGSFGIAVMNLTASATAKVTQVSDGQPQATSGAVVTTISDGQPQAATKSAAVVSQISDGQPQVKTMAPVSQISDGQIQGGMHTMTMAPVTQIGDGQVQAPKSTAPAVSQISDGQPQAATGTAVSQISDGQPQAATGTAVSQISDGQPQAATGTAVSQISDGQPQAATGTAVSQKSDGQPQAATGTAVSQKSDGQPQATTGTAATPSASSYLVACKSNSTLTMSLANGVLKDDKGRTGYIASNYQFQFDDPPQAGAIFTSGFSVCGNGSLALGGSNVFYQCLSGNFYNLYDRSWAAQCSPVTINALVLTSC